MYRYILFALFSYIVYRMFIKSRGIFIVLIPVIYNMIWMMGSIAFIESGIFISEIGMTTYDIGSTVRLFIYYTVFLICIYSLDRKYPVKVKAPKIENKIIMIVTIILLLAFFGYQLLDSILSINVLTQANVTRFNYYSSYSTLPMVEILVILANPMLIIAGIYYLSANNKWQKFLGIAPLMLYCLSLYLRGEQFGNLFRAIIFFVMPVLIEMINKGEKIFTTKRVFIIVAIVIIVIFPKYIYFMDNSLYGIDARYDKSAVGRLMFRALGLQAATWWKSDYIVTVNGFFDPSQIFNEFKAFFDDKYRYNSGIWYVMRNIMPLGEYNRYMLGGATMNNGYPGLNIMIFGHVGAAISVVLDAIFTFFISKLVLKFINGNRMICAFLATCVLNQVFAMINMSGIWYLGNFIPMFSMITLFVYSCIGYRRIVLKRR